MNKISIVIPLYKVKKHIERCLQSVLCQTFTSYEVILVDDASPDDSCQIAEALLRDNNISFQSIVHKENKKQGAARNSGLKVAKGQYVFFIDADDKLFDENALQILYSEMAKDNYDFVTAKEQHVRNGKKIYDGNYNCKVELLENGKIIKALSKHQIAPVVWNKLIRKDFLLENGILFLENTYFEDIPYCPILCHKAKKVAIINRITYVYYFQENANATTFVLDERKVNDAANMCKELLSYSSMNKIDVPIVHSLVLQALLYVLAHPSLLQDKQRWTDSYLLFRKMYNNSFLVKYKRSLYFSSRVSFFLVKQKYSPKKYTVAGFDFIQNLVLTAFIRLNFYYKLFA